MSGVEITAENFDSYFFDVRKNGPKKGQVMAKFSAVAELVDEGRLKRDVIDLLLNHPRGGEAASKVMRKLGGAIERDSYKIPREMAEDLALGLTVDEVAAKPYRFVIEHFFYTQKEFVPVDDPHWELIPVLNYVERDETKGIDPDPEVEPVPNEAAVEVDAA
jgi:hypothetical protein